jgi:hypothetical protein
VPELGLGTTDQEEPSQRWMRVWKGEAAGWYSPTAQTSVDGAGAAATASRVSEVEVRGAEGTICQSGSQLRECGMWNSECGMVGAVWVMVGEEKRRARAKMRRNKRMERRGIRFWMEGVPICIGVVPSGLEAQQARCVTYRTIVKGEYSQIVPGVSPMYSGRESEREEEGIIAGIVGL